MTKQDYAHPGPPSLRRPEYVTDHHANDPVSQNFERTFHAESGYQPYNTSIADFNKKSTRNRQLQNNHKLYSIDFTITSDTTEKVRNLKILRQFTIRYYECRQ